LEDVYDVYMNNNYDRHFEPCDFDNAEVDYDNKTITLTKGNYEVTFAMTTKNIKENELK
jgi:glutathione peroxidase-family protein